MVGHRDPVLFPARLLTIRAATLILIGVIVTPLLGPSQRRSDDRTYSSPR
jgi:hypothetical protein